MAGCVLQQPYIVLPCCTAMRLQHSCCACQQDVQLQLQPTNDSVCFCASLSAGWVGQTANCLQACGTQSLVPQTQARVCRVLRRNVHSHCPNVPEVLCCVLVVECLVRCLLGVGGCLWSGCVWQTPAQCVCGSCVDTAAVEMLYLNLEGWLCRSQYSKVSLACACERACMYVGL